MRARQYAAVATLRGRVFLSSRKEGSLLFTIARRIPCAMLDFEAMGIDDVDGDERRILRSRRAGATSKGFVLGRRP